MEFTAYLITPQGHWLKPGSEQYYNFIEYDSADFDVVGYALRNMGAIAVGFAGDTLCVALRLPLIAGEGLKSLIARLGRIAKGEVRVDILTDAWRSEVYNSGIEAGCRLESLRAHAEDASYPHSGGVTEPLSLSSVMIQDNHPMKPVLQKWRANFNRFDDTVLDFITEKGLLDRTVIASVDGEGEPIFSFIGSGFRFYGRRFPVEAIGGKVRDQPDKDYGLWTDQIYRDTVHQEQPRLEQVRASIRSGDSVVHHTKYSRLLLPWFSCQRVKMLTAISLLENGTPDDETTSTPGNM